MNLAVMSHVPCPLTTFCIYSAPSCTCCLPISISAVMHLCALSMCHMFTCCLHSLFGICTPCVPMCFFLPVFRIHMFLGLPDPDPDPLVRGMDPDPDPSFASKNSKKNLVSTVLWLFWTFFENDVNVSSKSNKQKNCFKKLFFVGNLKVTDKN